MVGVADQLSSAINIFFVDHGPFFWWYFPSPCQPCFCVRGPTLLGFHFCVLDLAWVGCFCFDFRIFLSEFCLLIIFSDCFVCVHSVSSPGLWVSCIPLFYSHGISFHNGLAIRRICIVDCWAYVLVVVYFAAPSAICAILIALQSSFY